MRLSAFTFAVFITSALSTPTKNKKNSATTSPGREWGAVETSSQVGWNIGGEPREGDGGMKHLRIPIQRKLKHAGNRKPLIHLANSNDTTNDTVVR
eukprot:731038-Amorphochlora_amoeboformis.AAC.1